ncbi:MAG: RNA methylase, NOL1/NOP2/sun family protein, partial [Planctomycetota bacterium]|nr:RNA methylase, NOL1/NOP2/sun family protein [Planctomycetota bacterium]
MEDKGLNGDQDLLKMMGSIEVPESLEAFRSGLQERHGSAIRKRRDFSVQSLPFSCEPIPWYDLGYHPVESITGPTRTLAYASGAYFVQDAGSLLALALCGADKQTKTPLLVCDLCAAPGAKASALLEHVHQSGGFLLANEVIGSRIAALSSNLSRTGSNRFAVTSLDPEHLVEKIGAVFDLVLVDAPCSGQAMLSRGKQTSSSFSRQQVEHSAS